MTYFDDIIFINAGSIPYCLQSIDMSYPTKYSLQYYQSGKAYYGVNHRKKSILEGPVLTLFLPENSYQYGSVDKKGYHHCYINIWGSRADRIIREGFLPLMPDGYASISNPVEFSAVYNELGELVCNWDQSYQIKAVLLLEQLLALFIESTQIVKQQNPHHHKIQELTLAIKNDPFREWNFQHIARKSFFLSYSHFRRIFKDITSVAPKEFLINSRMQSAAERLRTEHLSIKELAVGCGFDDPARFSRMFKKKIGLSPQAYLKALMR